MNKPLDVQAERKNIALLGDVYRAGPETITACLDVIEQMATVIQKIDFFGVALIARSYEPGSRTVRELVDEAHAALALVK